MKKSLLIIPVSIVLAIFFYPTTSISNTGGSPGGKTDSPSDGASCTGCHYAGSGTGAIITTNISANGYTPNQVYTITANINQSGINKFGFEITSEEANFGSAKKGTFFITNNTETKLTNNNKAVTHKLGGTQGSGMKNWSMDWEAPNSGTGSITFFGAFIEGNMDQTNSGDIYHSTTLTVNESTPSSIQDFVINKKLLKVTDLLGRETNQTNKPLFYIYDDGTVEKKIIIE